MREGGGGKKPIISNTRLFNKILGDILQSINTS